jgi:hypothetical protein
MSIPLFLQKVSTSYFKIVRDEADLNSLLSKAKSKIASIGERARNIKKFASFTTRNAELASKATRQDGSAFVFPATEVKKWPSTTKHTPVRRSGDSPPQGPMRTPKFVSTPGARLSEHMKKNILMNTPRGNFKPRILSPKHVQTTEPARAECVICFEREADSVFMECGHGGMCYDCGVDIWTKSNECFLCRKPIMCLLQLDPAALAENVVKVIACVKIQEEETETKQYLSHNQAILSIPPQGTLNTIQNTNP